MSVINSGILFGRQTANFCAEIGIAALAGTIANIIKYTTQD
jgi:hypothetical protein